MYLFELPPATSESIDYVFRIVVYLSRQNFISFLWDIQSIKRPIEPLEPLRPLRNPLRPTPVYRYWTVTHSAFVALVYCLCKTVAAAHSAVFVELARCSTFWSLVSRHSTFDFPEWSWGYQGLKGRNWASPAQLSNG